MADSTSSPIASQTPLATLTADDFERLESRLFYLHTQDARHCLELVEISKRASPRPGIRGSYSLLFKGPEGLKLSQGTYLFEHEILGTLYLFTVLIFWPEGKGFYFEVIFG